MLLITSVLIFFLSRCLVLVFYYRLRQLSKDSSLFTNPLFFLFKKSIVMSVGAPYYSGLDNPVVGMQGRIEGKHEKDITLHLIQ